MALVSLNPTTETVTAEFDEMSDAVVDAILKKSVTAFQMWKKSSFADRAQRMNHLADVLDRGKRTYAQLMTEEMGKPITAGLGEIEKCAWVCRYYAEQGESFLADEPVVTDSSASRVQYEPLGPVLAIMPWNFPFWQVFRAAVPALFAGNTMLLKHASNVPRCTLALEDIFKSAGFPEDVFRSLLISGAKTGRIIADSHITAVTITGSTAAGRAVAAAAGQALKKTVLELGGSDPFIVLDDADVARAAEIAVQARMVNTGQSCIAAKRFIVVASQYNAFVEAFTMNMGQLHIGDPMREETQVGPLARADLRDALDVQVSTTIARGARCIRGGKKHAGVDGRGFFYEPTIIADVEPGMPMYDEETFGPAAAIIRAADETDAIRIANDTIYGLGASLWTRDLGRADVLSRSIDAGAVFINGMVKSDPRLPFGGIKESGYGRELGKEGIREFVNKKTFWVA